MHERIRYEKHGPLAFWDHHLRENPLPEFHRHDEVEIGLVEKGYMDVLLGGDVVRQSSGTLTMFWGAMPHKVCNLTNPLVGKVMLLSLPWVLGLGLDARFCNKLFSGVMIHSTATAERQADRLAFRRWQGLLEKRSSERDRIVHLEVEARIRRLAMEVSGQSDGRSSSVRVGKVEQMIRLINEHYEERLSALDIAEHVDLHPKYATTLFRKACGMSIMRYVAQVRVMRAKAILATEDAKMIDVAMRVGFGAVSQFYSTFRAVAGVTPAAFRGLARASK